MGTPVFRWLPLGLACFFWITWYLVFPDPLFPQGRGTLILDSQGLVLDARLASDEQWRFEPSQDEVPPVYSEAVIRFEDRRFYHHPGVDPLAILRALVQNIRAKRIVSGGSTISMQVIRLSREGKPRTLGEKIREASLALKLELRYSKAEILRLYGDNAPFGGNIVGLEAASRRYFDRAPQELSWAEAALLAILPNNPSRLHVDRNREELERKRNNLLQSLYVGGSIDETVYQSSVLEPIPQTVVPLTRIVPGLYSRVISDGRMSSTTQTTIKRDFQESLLSLATTHARDLYNFGVGNIGILVVDIRDNTVVGYIGNTPLDIPEIQGRDVDMIQARRSTGSTLKPFLYAAMLDSGEMLPTELLLDIPVRFGSYSPQNHTRAFLGAVPANQALSRSLNIPFVKALGDFGVSRFKELLENLGMTTLHRRAEDYGLPLIIGGGEGTLWESTAMFTSLTRLTLGLVDQQGAIEEPKLYLGVVPNPALDHDLDENRDGKTSDGTQSPISAQAWYLTLKALQQVDRPGIDSAWQRFSTGSPIAWKTGTSQGLRDAWAIGVSPRYAVGVWAGNALGPGTAGLRGTYSAAPVLFDVFRLLGLQPDFPRPLGLARIDVSRDSGFLPVPHDANLITIDALPASEASGRISPFHQSSNPPVFVLPPAQGYYYRLWNPSYQPPQITGQGTSPLGILVPQEGITLVIPVDYQEEKQVVFEAFHTDPEGVLFWHLNTTFLGSTQFSHTMAVRPDPGTHVLMIVDDEGNQLVRNFFVSGSGTESE